VGWVGSEKFPKILKLVIYYVCNLYQTAFFVNLQFGASIYYRIIYYITDNIAMFVDRCLSDSHNVSAK